MKTDCTFDGARGPQAGGPRKIRDWLKKTARSWY